jgi:hypothetical protein
MNNDDYERAEQHERVVQLVNRILEQEQQRCEEEDSARREEPVSRSLRDYFPWLRRRRWVTPSLHRPGVSADRS